MDGWRQSEEGEGEMRILFLDDDEERQRRFLHANIGHVVVQARTAAEAIAALEREEQFDAASLDHDLDPYATMGQTPRDPTGQAVVDAMVSRPRLRAKLPTEIVLHSFNRDGARRMAMTLRSYGVRAFIRPFRPWEAM